MKDNAKILLGIMRDANRQNISLDHRVFDIIYRNLGIDKQGLDEVTAILEADLLEKVAMKPEFEQVKSWIKRKGR
jgi:hypothetical protein